MRESVFKLRPMDLIPDNIGTKYLKWGCSKKHMDNEPIQDRRRQAILGERSIRGMVLRVRVREKIRKVTGESGEGDGFISSCGRCDKVSQT